MNKCSTVVVGGGAAGIAAAITTARRGESVIICEKTPQLGKKILATGNGRCNLLNDNLNESGYNPKARELVRKTFAKFGKSVILDFFQELGLRVYSAEGRVFPVTNQAASVLKVLEMELSKLGVPVKFTFDCINISSTRNGILVSAKDGEKIECRKVIVTGGGKTYPSFGSDGSIYGVVRQLGHSIVEPIPVVVPLVVKDSLCQVLQGQRITATARSVIEGRKGEAVGGELLFTKYGLSGTCILDVSEAISAAINRHHQSGVFVEIDMAPFMGKEQLKDELKRRQSMKWAAEEMLVGILPNKISFALRDVFKKQDIDAGVREIKSRRFKVNGTRGWNEAEFTSGGVNLNEVNPETLESKLKKGVCFAGEVLDVNGRRGGYNLGWAWASGFAAGSGGY
jgi:predicted Rossmann fold flavoprotein